MASVRDLVVGTGHVRGGRLFIHHRAHFDAQIRQLDSRWTVEVTIQRLRATRSQQQNKYYWSVVIATLAEHTGYTPDELHEVLKQKFIPKRLALCDGNGEVKGEFVMGGSTRTMKTHEFSEYVEAIKRWASEDLDVYIPDSHEVRRA
jgi:hypothetical protein